MKYLVTGGTGSLGSLLVPTLLNSGQLVRVLSRDSHKQAAMRRQYPQVEYVLGDVRDADVCRRAVQDVDFVIHTAAMKRIEAALDNSEEMLSVNIDGTRALVQAIERAGGLQAALFISTDKASAPETAYGASKFCAEQLWLSANKRNRTQFRAVRYGNVMDSEGGVWQLWQKALRDGKPLVVRFPEPTRFMMLRVEAVAVVLSALGINGYTGLLVPYGLPAFSVHDLARYLEPNESKWERADYVASEKQHETLVSHGEGVHNWSWRVAGTAFALSSVESGYQEAIPASLCSATATRHSASFVAERLQNASLDEAAWQRNMYS